MTTRDFMAESLVYERAHSRLSRIIDQLLEEKNGDAEKSKETGEPIDKSYKVLADLLDGVKNHVRNVSDELWTLAEKSAQKYDAGYDRLYMAIMERAVLDYEAALCGYGSAEDRRQIEELGMDSILYRVRRAHPKFVKTARENGKQIYEETQEARKKHKDIDEWNTIKCPLCGHTLYSYGRLIGGCATIRCTGCSFTEVVPVDN